MRKIFSGLAIIMCLAACKGTVNSNSGTADSTAARVTNNIRTAMASEEAMIKQDIAGMTKYCAADFVDYGNSESKPMNNLDSIKAGLKMFFIAFPDFKGDSLHAIGQGDTVIVTGIWSGTFKQAYMGLPATNKTFRTRDADIFIFNKDGKITSHRSIQSEAAFLSQLGIKIPDTKK